MTEEKGIEQVEIRPQTREELLMESVEAWLEPQLDGIGNVCATRVLGDLNARWDVCQALSEAVKGEHSKDAMFFYIGQPMMGARVPIKEKDNDEARWVIYRWPTVKDLKCLLRQVTAKHSYRR